MEDLITLKKLRGETSQYVGAWAWGLLAKCRELECMTSEEVGVVRKLGQRAVFLLRRIAAGELNGIEHDAGEEAHVEETGAVTDGETIHATLDIIVTIVGECFGQRDLLDLRLTWEEME